MDKLKQINFWQRLAHFVDNIQVNDLAGNEEKEMIISVCNDFTSLHDHTIDLPKANVGEEVSATTVLEEMNKIRYSEKDTKILKIGDKVLTELKKHLNHISTQLNKENNISFNTGFHEAFILGYIQHELSNLSSPVSAPTIPSDEKVLQDLYDKHATTYTDGNEDRFYVLEYQDLKNLLNDLQSKQEVKDGKSAEEMSNAEIDYDYLRVYSIIPPLDAVNKRKFIEHFNAIYKNLSPSTMLVSDLKKKFIKECCSTSDKVTSWDDIWNWFQPYLQSSQPIQVGEKEQSLSENEIIDNLCSLMMKNTVKQLHYHDQKKLALVAVNFSIKSLEDETREDAVYEKLLKVKLILESKI